MVDNATLKNPNGILPDREKTTELDGERRTWTLRDSPEAGTYTLQAIVETREKELQEAQIENQPVDVKSAVQVYTPQTISENESDETISEELDLDAEEQEIKEEEEEKKEEQVIETRATLIKKQVELAKKERVEKEKRASLSFGWFLVTLIFALFFDILGFLINFIPILGQLITSIIITPLCLGFIWLMHIINGVQFNSRAKAQLALTGIIEFIPVIQIIPALTAYVLLVKSFPLVENKVVDAVDVTGGKQISEVGQKQLSHPNSAIMNEK